MIRGTELIEIKLYAWDNAGNTWVEEEEEIEGYAGQGFQQPSNAWIDRPTGTLEFGGMVFLLPRSAESEVQPQPPDGFLGLWTLREC